jgi:hypothetical protein
MERINIVIRPDQLKLLKDLKKRKKANMSFVVRDILDYYFESCKSLNTKEKIKELEGKIKALEGEVKRK